MSIVDITYEKLNNTIGISKYQYSKDWLKKSMSYYAYLNSTGAEASNDVLLGIWGEALRKTHLCEELAKKYGNTLTFNENKRVYETIAEDVSSELKRTAMEM